MHSNQLVRITYIISNNKMWPTKTYILPLNKWTINIQNSTGIPFSINDAIFIFVISYPFLFFFHLMILSTSSSYSLIRTLCSLYFFFFPSFDTIFFWYLSFSIISGISLNSLKLAFLLCLLSGETSFFISQNKIRRLQNHSGFLKN
jgi:hypothetical protein